VRGFRPSKHGTKIWSTVACGPGRPPIGCYLHHKTHRRKRYRVHTQQPSIRRESPESVMLPGTGPSSPEWFIDAVADGGTWEWWDEPVAQRVGDPAYRESIARATERSGVDEAVLTGEARIGGHRVVLVVSEFGFLAGSIGHCAARRIIRAVERATAMR